MYVHFHGWLKLFPLYKSILNSWLVMKKFTKSWVLFTSWLSFGVEWGTSHIITFFCIVCSNGFHCATASVSASETCPCIKGTVLWNLSSPIWIKKCNGQSQWRNIHWPWRPIHQQWQPWRLRQATVWQFFAVFFHVWEALYQCAVSGRQCYTAAPILHHGTSLHVSLSHRLHVQCREFEVLLFMTCLWWLLRNGMVYMNHFSLLQISFNILRLAPSQNNPLSAIYF